MCDYSSTDGASPVRLGASLAVGFLSGLTAALWALMQGWSWIGALAAYSGAGSVAVLAAASAMALRCHLAETRESARPAPAPVRN